MNSVYIGNGWASTDAAFEAEQARADARCAAVDEFKADLARNYHNEMQGFLKWLVTNPGTCRKEKAAAMQAIANLLSSGAPSASAYGAALALDMAAEMYAWESLR